MAILIFCSVLLFSGTAFSQDKTYVLTASKVFRVGTSEKVVVQAFGYEKEFAVNVALRSFPDKLVSYSSGRISLTPDNKFQDAVTLTLQPADLARTEDSVKYVYLEAVSPHFTRLKKIPVSYENGFLFIHTDKPVYTPDQSVKVRVYSLNEDLQPARRETVLTFVDPDGVKVDIIEEKDFTGIVSFPDFKIPPNPKYGIWKIEAKYKKDFITSAVANFEVKEYALPSFSIVIQPERNFISSDKFENFRIAVKASYFYNKRLPSADVFLRFGIIEGTGKRMMPRAMHVTRLENGVAEISFNSKKEVSDLGFQSLEELDGSYLYIAASVMESTGGLSGEVEYTGVRYVVSPYKLNLIATPLFIKPGLPFFVKVQVKDTVDHSVGNIPVTLTAKSFTEQMDETELISEGSEAGRRKTSINDGTALFVINIPSDSTLLEFQIKTVDPHLSDENQATKTYEARAYSSLSRSYLYIDWASNHKILQVGDFININVYPHSRYIHKIHHYSYLITSKGKIVSFGTQKRIKDLEYEHLSFQITQEMVPSARLIVYYIVMGEETAELVADSVWLNVEQKCGNSLDIKVLPSKKTHRPAEVLSLYMKTQFSSFVALSSIDKAVYGVTGRGRRAMEKVMQDLEKSDLGCGAGGGRNNVDVFRMAGLTFLTNANADDSNEADETCKVIVRTKRSDFVDQIHKEASKYKHPAIKNCCMAGVKAYPVSETCSDRARRVRGNEKCISAFKDCCEFANRLRDEEPNKLLMLSRTPFSQDKTYVLTASKVFRVGTSEKVVVQAFGYEKEFAVNVALRSFPDKLVSYSSGRISLTPDNKFQDAVTLTLQPADLARTEDSVKYVYLEAVSPHFTRLKKIPVSYENGFLFIHTDKPVYTPDQSVKVRVYSLNEDLQPARRETVLTFVDPDGVKVDIIEEKDFTGIVSFPDFKIPPNPKYGIWKIEAKYKKDFITSAVANFEVKEYALPSFSIVIQPERNFISSDKFENFRIAVKASYFYNKRLPSADVFLRFGIIEGTGKRMMPRAMHVTRLENGVAEISFNSKKEVSDLGFQSLEELDGSYLYIAASVMESTGGLSGEVEYTGVRYVVSPYKLNLIATPLFIKPGLPFFVKVQVKDTVDHSVGNIPVTLTAKSFTEQMDETELISEGSESGRRITSINDGTALFVINIPSDSTLLEFQIKTVDPHLSDENQATKTYEARAYSSLSRSYLYIDWASNHKVLQVGDFININVYPHSRYIHKIHHYSYLITSKGKIVSFGTQKRIKDLEYEHLSFQITQEMVPSARLIVYYIVMGEETAELVADSVWLNVEQKCGNSLDIKVLPSKKTHRPAEVLSLYMKTQFSSFVALSSIDKAVYGVIGRGRRAMEKVMQDLEKSDLGCGAGGGRNNVDVFRMAGLTFLTNANADDSNEADETCNEIVRTKRSDFQERIHKEASKYKHPAIKNCCMAGVKAYPVSETCSDRARRIRSNEKCISAFRDCCEFANRLREEEPNKLLILARMHFEAILELDEAEVRSYFPESWLWEVHQVSSRSKSLSITLPDSLTTWEVQGVGISDKGICVTAPLEVQVVKDIFLNVYVPYSVVRGEQIELKGSVYNHRASSIKFCVKIAVGDGICSFGGSATTGSRIRGCNLKYLGSSSSSPFMFRILPLELGLHTINFTLLTDGNSETVVKTLRVMPEGIKKELHAGFTLDPQGVYGAVKRRQEFRYKIPLNLVPKTKIDRSVSVKGHLMGEVIATVLNPSGISILTNLPKGSAEAELMSIAPLFYVFHYLEASDNWHILGSKTLTSRTEMRRKMKEGIVSVLSYRNADFSYSMWKNGQASTWLTAFALRILGQVNQYINLDQISVCNSLLWLIDNCQMPDGSFNEFSDYQPVKLQGTLPREAKEKSLYLTAFSIIGIEKSMKICPTQKIHDAKNKAGDYLMKNAESAQSPFTMAIISYALALVDLNHQSSRLLFSALKKEASVIGEPPIYRFWKDSLKTLDHPTPNSVTAQMVETTAYALLTALLRGDKNYANPIIKWLSEEQRYGGGFYSTQDTINALEALTEYSLLVKRLNLDMSVKVAYKNYGDLHLFKLTEENFVGRTLTVPLEDDIYVSTGSSTGIATVNVRTVYNLIGTSEESCNFELKIVPKRDDGYRIEDGGPLGRIEACAKYKPSTREPQSGSAHAVMDIGLVSGLEANIEDLNTLASGVDQLIADYEIIDGHVVIQIDSVPADSFLCVGFRISELFHVGMRNPATFTVYEYHAPDKRCTIFYNPYGDEKLVRLCEGNECKCMEAECSRIQGRLDQSITADIRREAACQNDIAYVYKVNILSRREEGHFVKYSATILDLYKRGQAFAEKNNEITFVKKKTCTDVELSPGEQYLIMGKEALKISIGYSFRFQYPLDSSTWIEWWPSNTACTFCQEFLNRMEDFVEDLIISGC